MNARIPQPTRPLVIYADEQARLSDLADKIFLEQAREEIVSTVMLYGVYPQPRSNGKHRPIQFSLEEFLFDTAGKTYFNAVELERFFVLAMIDGSNYGTFSDRRNAFEKEVTEILEAHFDDDHHLVRELADQMQEDAREES